MADASEWAVRALAAGCSTLVGRPGGRVAGALPPAQGHDKRGCSCTAASKAAALNHPAYWRVRSDIVVGTTSGKTFAVDVSGRVVVGVSGNACELDAKRIVTRPFLPLVLVEKSFYSASAPPRFVESPALRAVAGAGAGAGGAAGSAGGAAAGSQAARQPGSQAAGSKRRALA